MEDCLKHKGVIFQELPKCWVVRVVVSSACADCHARSACVSADHTPRDLYVPRDDRHFSPGEEVLVTLSRKDGAKAVALAYVIPLILFMTALFVVYALTGSQAWAAVGALVVPAPYYLLLHYFGDVLDRSFQCRIEKNIEGV